ncbi:MAG: hypothetical protein A2270_01185 [Elusimicrobia bacterium RIFOXYA12_FULL_51_18]|nr:MAG: hypothetical protein A2270_01185 [Elusimicrobia bacterium RIFOXYA12_FULL_51_18]OGS31083.1 MAG: hypothetical protein A2218_01950 [Elusimicrobia bacterium RIFOXYA2_FULL_53_38]
MKKSIVSVLFVFCAVCSTRVQARPFAEYEHANYLFMSMGGSQEKLQLQRRIIENLPPGIQVRLYYSYFPDLDVNDPPNVGSFRYDMDSLWARDVLPYAVMRPEGWTFVWPYDQDFGDFAVQFNRPMINSGSYIAGGNLMADRHGNCFTVDKNPAFLESVLEKNYGCKTTTVFPELGGIGHIDERLKIISDTEVLVDEPSFIPALKNMGYKVTLLPRPQAPYGNYSNSLLINGVVFMPVYGEPSDEEALRIYRSFNLKVVPLNSSFLIANKGAIHCMTMTYP